MGSKTLGACQKGAAGLRDKRGAGLGGTSQRVAGLGDAGREDLAGLRGDGLVNIGGGGQRGGGQRGAGLARLEDAELGGAGLGSVMLGGLCSAGLGGARVGVAGLGSKTLDSEAI